MNYSNYKLKYAFSSSLSYMVLIVNFTNFRHTFQNILCTYMFTNTKRDPALRRVSLINSGNCSAG